MKITTYLDEKLLEKAMKAVHAKTKREALERGLKTLLSEKSHLHFVRDFGRFDLTWSHDRLMRSRT